MSAPASAAMRASLASSRGYALQVGGIAELGRIHEQRDDYGVALGARAANQRRVSFVERAHRRHEADPSARARASEGRAHFGNGPEDQSWFGDGRQRPYIGTRSGAYRSMAARWASMVAASPRAIGPVSSKAILDGALHQRHQRLRRCARGFDQSRRGAIDRHEIVRRDRRTGVIKDAIAIRDHDRLQPERACKPAGVGPASALVGGQRGPGAIQLLGAAAARKGLQGCTPKRLT